MRERAHPVTASSDVPRVSVMMEGFLIREGANVLDASSTVVLVEAGSTRLVVDTGSTDRVGELTRLFRRRGIPLDSIRLVVNTHLHSDHFGGNGLFSGATVVAHPLESPPLGTKKVSQRVQLTPGVEVVPTPGHTAGSLSVFVRSDKKIVICGDAIPTRQNFDKHVPPSMNIDPKLAISSLDMIAGWADIVIPGHGPPFDVPAKV